MQYDLIIIGGGPAGLSAAIYAKRAGLSVMVLESGMCGGQTVNTPEIENYPAIEKIAGFEMAQSMYNQAHKLGTVFEYSQVTGMEMSPDGIKTVKTASGEYSAKAVIIANGAKRRKLGCKGEDAFSGRGVSYCATCDGSFFRGRTAFVVGGGNTAAEDAAYLAGICESVHIVHRRDAFRAEKHLLNILESCKNVVYHLNSAVSEIKGDIKVNAVVLNDLESGKQTEHPTDAVFVAIGLAPDNRIFENLILLDKSGYIVAGEDCKTDAEGIYAAGDTRTKTLRQIVTAASDGAIAATAAAEYIRSR